MKELKEHKKFRNKLIIATIVILTLGISINITDFITVGVIFGILALYNIFAYKQNKKDHETLKDMD